MQACAKVTDRFALLSSQIWLPRQLQEAFLHPNSLNTGWPSNRYLFELEAAALRVKQPGNDQLVQLNAPDDTCWI